MNSRLKISKYGARGLIFTLIFAGLVLGSPSPAIGINWGDLAGDAWNAIKGVVTDAAQRAVIDKITNGETLTTAEKATLGLIPENTRKEIGEKLTQAQKDNLPADIKTLLGIPLTGDGSGVFENPLQAKTFQELVERLINFAFVVSLALAPLMVLIAGLVWLTAGGRPDAITRGRNILYWTLIGFTIVLLARGLIAVLKSILGG